MAFKQYENPDELRKLQDLCTDILGEFDRVCTQLGIPYIAYGGTAIGAVRHKGFIPWDDDVDVALTREHYEAFLKKAPEILGDAFDIVNMRTNDNFTCSYSYMTLKDTLCIPEFYKDASYRKPISIDIFPLDKVASDEGLFRKQHRRTWLWGRLIFLRTTPTPYLSIEGWKKALVLLACSIAHWSMRLLHISPRWLQKKWEQAARMCEHEDISLYADFTDQDPLRWSAAESELFPTQRMAFETISVELPREYDALLTRGYGTYTQLPPEEDRKNHYPAVLDFGPYR